MNFTRDKGQIKPKANWRAIGSPKKQAKEFGFFANLLTVLSDLYKYFFKLLDQTYSKFVLSLNSPPKPQSNQFLILFFCKLLAINLPSGSTNSVLQRLVSNHKLG